MSMLNGKVPEDCAICGKCTVYFTAEADGGIYPCDLYVLDKWRMGNINTVNYLKLRKSEAARTFRAISLNLPQECTSCPWYDRLCLGGCLRDREPVIDGVPSLNRFCKSYKMFFEARHNEMENLAVYLRDHPRVR